MPRTAWSAKRERQYAHIKDSLVHRGKPEPLAEEIAARVVNKERAQHGESVEASASSLDDMPASREAMSRLAGGEINDFIIEKRYVTKSRKTIDAITYVKAIRDRAGAHHQQRAGGCCRALRAHARSSAEASGIQPAACAASNTARLACTRVR